MTDFEEVSKELETQKSFISMQKSTFGTWYKVFLVPFIKNHLISCDYEEIRTMELRLDNMNGWGEGLLFLLIKTIV